MIMFITMNKNIIILLLLLIMVVYFIVITNNSIVRIVSIVTIQKYLLQKTTITQCVNKYSSVKMQ